MIKDRTDRQHHNGQMIKDKQWSTKPYSQKLRSTRTPVNKDRTDRQQHNGLMSTDKQWSTKYYTQKLRSTRTPLNTDRTDRQTTTQWPNENRQTINDKTLYTEI